MDSNLVSTPATKKDRQIEDEIKKLAVSMKGLFDRISNLSQRLSPALREAVPSENKDEKQVKTPLVEIANNIRQVRYTAEANISLINNILEHLEMG